MTTFTDLMPATDHAQNDPTARLAQKEVKAMGKSRNRDPRAWDELSEIDRLVLLEVVRQRRAAREQVRRAQHSMYGMRQYR